MSYTNRLLAICCMLFASGANAVEFFADALYWQATETVEWVLINSLSTPNQSITYKTLSFDYEPGFRIGVVASNNWDFRLYYTNYYTSASDSASGNLTSTFFGGKVVQASNAFQYTSGQVNFFIHFNNLDLDMSKEFRPSASLYLRPVVGLRGAWIKQRVITTFKGPISVAEFVNNNFSGLGPKAALETKWVFHSKGCYMYSLFANFTTSYLWGKWNISDVVNSSSGLELTTTVGKRDFGAFTLQGIMGLGLDYKSFVMTLGYELNDWFNQYQVTDDGTGAHNNDLLLQGLTLRVSYCF